MIESEKNQLIRKSVREFAAREITPIAASIDENECIPKELYQKMAENQYFGVTIPEKYGGCGAGYVAMAIVMEELAKASVSATLYVTSPNTLLGLPILNYGTEEQKQKYLVPVVTGKKEGTFALTEPSAGSDAATQSTIAKKDGEYFVINGRKSFITAAPLCDFAVVFASTDTSLGIKGITAFIIERDTPGYSIGIPERKMGVCGSPMADIILKDVRVHKSQILGEEGNAFGMAMKTLDSGRLVVAAQCLGIAEAAMEEAIKYVKQRRQFGRLLSEFQGLQFILADMETKICCARAMIYDTAEKKDAGMNISKEAAVAKYYASEICNEVAAKALQLHGGYGYVKDYAIERIFRDARVTTIYEGTSQILQTVIARQVLK
ncbi:MAG: acyl-CoA dehydrogenase family protein [Acetivibrio sp.]